jgi:hypothetical protein
MKLLWLRMVGVRREEEWWTSYRQLSERWGKRAETKASAQKKSYTNILE